MVRIATLVWIAACAPATASQAPLAPIDPPQVVAAPLGPFGVYAWRPDVDAFPDATFGDGWGVRSGPNDVRIHFIVLQVDHDDPAAAAVARRGDVSPKLPTGTKLIYEAAHSAALPWTVNSVVVASTPVLDPAAVATCEIVGRPDVVIDLTTNETTSLDWPWVRLTWTPAGVATLQAVVDADRQTRFYLALGDDAVDHWTPGLAHDGVGVAELKIPQPDAKTAWAYAKRNPQLCPKHP